MNCVPDVTLLRHRGRLAALPVSHVRAAVRALPEQGEVLSLWEGEASQDGQWALCVPPNDAAPLYLPCEWMRIAQLPRGEVFPLTPILQEAFAGTPVVGMARREGDAVWLVDLATLASAG